MLSINDNDLFKKVSKVISKKALLWIIGLLGIKGIAVSAILLFTLLILIGGMAGGSINQEHEDEMSSGGGMYMCSPTGELDMDKWNAIFESSRSGVLQGYGDKILELSEEKGIDPVLFAAIAMHETSWGTSNAIIKYNNPGGLMGSNGLMRFSSLDEGLESMARTLHNRIIRDGLVTIEQLGSVYAPPGADNDPNGLNENWVPTVKNIVSQFGGLTMNCELMTGVTFNFDDMDISELRKNIAKTGFKWIGSPYVWSGGRNPASASRGEFDCSSFVHWVYAENGIMLGNQANVSTETLKYMGKRISINEIKVGDLIFWDTYKKDGHVGIYIGNNKFIGAQSSTGVAVVSLNDPYWESRFNGHVRRIINE